MADRVTFTKGSAERIAQVVRIVEAGNRDTGGLPTSPRFGASNFRLQLATFTGDWQTGEYKTVTLEGSTNTASVYNWCNPSLDAGCSGSSASRYVIFGKVNGTQSAVELPAKQDVFRIGTFNGAWDINSAKTVTFKYQACTPNTASVTNLFWPIPDSGTRDCSIAKEGTAWFLIVPRMFSANAATAATITTASLEFKTLPVVALATSSTATFSVSITTCATATA